MKKTFYILAAAAIIFAGCADNDTLTKDIREGNGENGGTIGFTSFTEKVTRAENSEALYSWTFFNHQESFQVWARKNNQPLKELFDGTKVTVTEDNGVYTYEYSPERYWDKVADNYFFYAAAPAPADGAAWSWTFNGDNTIIDGPSTINKGYFTIKDNKFSLNGVNLQSEENGGATAALKNVFKTATNNSVKDVDLLIADEAPVAKSFYNKANPDAVNLNFIHILSKLNITISTSLDDTDYDVDLLGFEVKNVPNTGSFNENTANLGSDKKWIRWTLDATPTKVAIPTGIEAYDASTYTIDDTKALDVPYTNTTAPAPVAAPGKTYIVESLIIPQNMNYERVALDGAAHDAVNQAAVPFATYEAYEKARHNDVNRLTEEQFNALVNAGAFVELSAYNQATGENIDQDQYDLLVADASAIKANNVAAYTAPAEPYFTITYSINEEVFTANYNLVAAFKNYDNDGHLADGTTAITENTFPFYEGWQNTLNIIIKPTAIQFTADVAKWSDNTEVSYEVK